MAIASKVPANIGFSCLILTIHGPCKQLVLGMGRKRRKAKLSLDLSSRTAVPSGWLEVELPGDLHISWAVIRCGGDTKTRVFARIAWLQVGQCHTMPVEDIEGFTLQLEVVLAFQVKVFDQADIFRLVNGTCDRLGFATKIAKTERIRRAEVPGCLISAISCVGTSPVWALTVLIDEGRFRHRDTRIGCTIRPWSAIGRLQP